MNKVYEIVTDRIIAELEKGTIPWRQPWKESGRPVNLVSRKPYQGINVILLRSTCRSSPYWLTFKQAKDLGGHVRKGEKATPVVFWKWTERTERDPETGEERKDRFPILRYYSVFNADQVEGIAVPEEAPRPFNPVEHAEGIISAMPSRPEIQHRGDRAYYSPRLDQVVLPPKGAFDSENGYYSVAFHELTHSTGHSSRLHRFDTEDLAPFGSTDYSKEELVAELGSVNTNGHNHVTMRRWNSRKLNTNGSRHTCRCSAATSAFRTSRCSTPSCMSPSMAANGAGYPHGLATGTPSTPA